jgi:hypothetical protein
MELSMDVFNVLRLLSFLDDNLGLVRETAAFEEQSLLTVTGYDAAGSRARYRFNPGNAKKRVDPISSRWRVQLGARYVF